jgi:hypothetical protein
MTWLAEVGPSVTPIGSATSDIVTYILGYGVVGIVALAFAFRFIVPRSALDEAREQARADLVKENERLIAEKRQAEEQRDEALKVAQTQIVPLLTTFTATTSALIPLLQELVRDREARRDRDFG